jgi:hypothetical protein
LRFIATPRADPEERLHPDVLGTRNLSLVARPDVAKLARVRAVMDFLAGDRRAGSQVAPRLRRLGPHSVRVRRT